MDPTGPLAQLAGLLDRYGYAAVVGLVMVESFGVPAPAQTLLVAAGACAATGRLNPLVVVLCGCLAAMAGDSVGFGIGRLGGRRLVLRAGKYVLLTERRLRRAEAMVDRHGSKIVVGARFVDGLRQVNGVLAGVADMPWRRFVAFNAIGAVAWSAIWTTVGYQAGARLGDILGPILRP